MTTFALVLGALLAIACVVFVSRPFLREPAVATDADRLYAPDAAARRRLSLAEERAGSAQRARVRPPHGEDLGR
jgi:hypothetical protein